MAQGFQPDSCSTTAQTREGSSEYAAAAFRARETSWAGGVISVPCCRAATSLPAGAVHVNEAHAGRQVERNPVMRGNAVQGIVDVRQMVHGDIADKGAVDFVV